MTLEVLNNDVLIKEVTEVILNKINRQRRIYFQYMWPTLINCCIHSLIET